MPRSSHFKFDIYDLFLALGLSGNAATLLVNGITVLTVVMLLITVGAAVFIRLWLNMMYDSKTD